MDHIAILRKSNIKKSDNLLQDILNGDKTIESRWYVNKIAPWNKIKTGDIVYLKESGQPITAKAKVSKVLQYEDLTDNKITEIIENYGKQIAPNISKQSFINWAQKNQNKRYCILVFLSDVTTISPFEIDKSGFGISSAWLCVDNIKKIIKKR